MLDPDRPQGTPVAQAEGSVHSDEHPWRLLALLIGATSVGPLSLNILAPAMPALMTPDEIAWLDAYHARVAATLSPLVAADTRAWLDAATRPLRG